MSNLRFGREPARGVSPGKPVRARVKSSDGRFWGAVAVLIVFFVVLAAHELSRPGIYYDEILLLMPMFDHSRWQQTPAWSPIPFFFNFYVGGLRLWYYYPFLKLFPISVELLRIPNILLYAASLAILARKFRQTFNGRWALVLVAALALNSNLMAAARTDSVPFLFGLLLRGLLLVWIFERGLSRRGLGSLAFGALLMVSGIFHRLDFLWGAFAVLGAGLIIEGAILHEEGKLRDSWRRMGGRAAVLAAISLLTGYAMSSGVERAGELGLDYSFLGRFLLLWNRVEAVLLGNSFIEYNLGPSFLPLPGTLVFYLALMAVPFLTSPREKPFRVAVFCALYTGMVFTIIFFVRRVGAAWHMLQFEPMLVIWWASGAYAVTKFFGRRGRLGVVTAGLVFGWLAVLQAYTYISYQRIYALPDHEISFNWNRAIYQLVDYRKRHPGDHFVNLGWGSYQEAGAFAFNRMVNDGHSFAAIREYLADPAHRDLLVVAPAVRLDAQVGADALDVRQFREAVAAGRLKAKLVQAIGEPNYPVYEIWSCSRP